MESLLISKEDLFVSQNTIHIENDKRNISINNNKRQFITNQNLSSKGQNKRAPKQDGKKTIAKRNERRDIILSLLKNNEKISVKDVSMRLPHYSEKTLQRELLKMVDESILQKEGERRWSKYSLVRTIL